MTDRPLNLPGSYPVRVLCRLERRIVTAISRDAVRAMVAAGAPASLPVLVHKCRPCNQYHVVTLGEISYLRELPRAS